MTAISGASVITPSAARLTESLRDIGYDFPAAVADIVDNSIAAGASRVDVTIGFDGEEPRVAIADDGEGMMPAGLLEALRFGSCRAYGRGELGRYGLGLKTAALSQCRSVTVATRPRVARGGGVTVLAMDLDLIAERDEWLAVEPSCDRVTDWARERLAAGPGTVVIWRKLDRALPEQRSDGGWARRGGPAGGPAAPPRFPARSGPGGAARRRAGAAGRRDAGRRVRGLPPHHHRARQPRARDRRRPGPHRVSPLPEAP